MKTCTHCKDTLPFTSFYKNCAKRPGLRAICKVCFNSGRKQEWRPSLWVERDKNLRYKYGITTAQKETMWVAQDKKCAVCVAVLPTLRSACVDHCHKTNKVRKLLCNGCNSALGFIKENFDTALNLAKYIQQDQGVV